MYDSIDLNLTSKQTDKQNKKQLHHTLVIGILYCTGSVTIIFYGHYYVLIILLLILKDIENVNALTKKKMPRM